MARKNKGSDRVATDGGGSFGSDAFAGLSASGLPEAPQVEPSKVDPPAPSRRERRQQGKAPLRLDVRREKSGRGGKTVLTVSGFTGFSRDRLDDLCRRIKSQMGVGGSVSGQTLEIQGQNRDRLMELLTAEGFRPVAAGG